MYVNVGQNFWIVSGGGTSLHDIINLCPARSRYPQTAAPKSKNRYETCARWGIPSRGVGSSPKLGGNKEFKMTVKWPTGRCGSWPTAPTGWLKWASGSWLAGSGATCGAGRSILDMSCTAPRWCRGSCTTVGPKASGAEPNISPAVLGSLGCAGLAGRRWAVWRETIWCPSDCRGSCGSARLEVIHPEADTPSRGCAALKAGELMGGRSSRWSSWNRSWLDSWREWMVRSATSCRVPRFPRYFGQASTLMKSNEYECHHIQPAKGVWKPRNRKLIEHVWTILNFIF